ncbi:TetR family transcriptional regulator [Herbihabitans rhizosphaerae]|uniref:TetR family transcriptional regulator n=1 Tax=Herbihabitans rhizosphaerae TaxID=1872711 RepID=A0A4Q7KR16_9PSEU|nr:TetR/AcrR family transcriptional regulator [Herbihabitans rhizosphaerae]RZS38924.1 TetR family transcriptional regulator [Herbihabitans rhizosphaerae]
MPTRRERLRAETATEIKTIALRLMAAGGPDAISLRAIAREMGMTAGAIYSYFPTRDDLVTTLIADLYTALLDAAERARDAAGSAPGARLLAWAEAVREWAVANPEGYKLIYGDPVPGYRAPTSGPAADAELRACAGLTELVAEVWPAITVTPSGTARWTDFDADIVALTRKALPMLPPAGFALALRMWGRMHGLIALEVYGHLTGQTRRPEKLFHAEMIDMITSLGLRAPK